MPSSSAAITARKRSSLSRSARSAASLAFRMVDSPIIGSMDDEEEETGWEEAVELPITDVLDLHSFRPSEVADVVRDYLDAAYGKGFRDLRIIHGKGIGVQRQTVRTLLG